MNDEMTNSEGVCISLLLIIAVICLSWATSYFVINYQQNRFSERRENCNRTVLSDKALSESGGFHITLGFDPKTPTLESLNDRDTELQHSIDKSNMQINKLTSLLSCYFDK